MDDIEVEYPQLELDEHEQMEVTDMEQPLELQWRAPKQIPSTVEQEMDEVESSLGEEKEKIKVYQKKQSL